MKLSALCCTYLRPEMLGRLIECFLRQDYPKELRELVILDDAGQYDNQSGDGWQLVSIPRRFATLGEKRNATAALASKDSAGFLVADDDDIYLPNWFSTTAKALEKAQWSRPTLLLRERGNPGVCSLGLKEKASYRGYHGMWAFRRETFYGAGGYRQKNRGEDKDLRNRLEKMGTTVGDPCEFGHPFYVYMYGGPSYHLSTMKLNGYDKLVVDGPPQKIEVSIGWPRDFSKMPVKRLPR